MNKKINEYLTRIAKAKSEIITFLNGLNINVKNSDNIEQITSQIKNLSIVQASGENYDFYKYIQNNNSEEDGYIDINYIPKENTIIETTFYLPINENTATEGCSLFGSRSSSSDNDKYYMYFNLKNNYINFMFANKQTGNKKFSATNDNIFTLRSDTNGVRLNGKLFSFNSTDETEFSASKYSIRLFSAYSADGKSLPMPESCKIYSFKIFETDGNSNDILVHYYIPFIDKETSKSGLLDILTNKKYYGNLETNVTCSNSADWINGLQTTSDEIAGDIEMQGEINDLLLSSDTNTIEVLEIDE
jgi:hypothetical protein